MTVKQLAEELNVSKTTIKNIIKKNNIIPQKELVNGQLIIVFTEEEVDRIRKLFAKNHPQTEPQTEPQTVESVRGNTEKITTNIPQNGANTANNEAIDSLISLLQQDLEAKNKQIEDLNSRLAEAMKALDQEQQLKAIAEKKILELEAKSIEKDVQKAADQDQETKKGFWKRLFSK